MEWIVLLVIATIVLLFVFISNISPKQDYPYQKQETLFTAAERSFYGVLLKAVGDKAIVFGKVRIADVLKTKKGLSASKRQTAFNQISAKHFDFVLCNPDYLSVLSVVELDDSSHSTKKRKARDDFLEKACEAAELKLHRFKATRHYNIEEIRKTIFAMPETQNKSSIPNQKIEPSLTVENSIVDSNPDKPVCPKCSSELILKVAKKGKHKGSIFLACSSFPNCRYIVKDSQNNNL